MVPSTENKISINALTQKKDYWARKLIAEFPNKTWTLSGLSYAYEKSRPQINSEDRREGKGTKRTMSTRENIESVQKLVLSVRYNGGLDPLVVSNFNFYF